MRRHDRDAGQQRGPGGRGAVESAPRASRTTTTLSGSSVSASTRTSGVGRDEQLTTRGRVAEQGGERRHDVRMQAQFRLLDAHERRRVVVTQDGQQTQIPQGAVGQSRGRHGDAVFLQEHLDGAPLHDHVEVRQPVVELAGRFQKALLDRGRPCAACSEPGPGCSRPRPGSRWGDRMAVVRATEPDGRTTIPGRSGFCRTRASRLAASHRVVPYGIGPSIPETLAVTAPAPAPASAEPLAGSDGQWYDLHQYSLFHRHRTCRANHRFR